MNWLWYLFLGIVIGIIVSLIHPGGENMGWLMTITIGVIGTVVAALIGPFTGRFDFWRISLYRGNSSGNDSSSQIYRNQG